MILTRRVRPTPPAGRSIRPSCSSVPGRPDLAAERRGTLKIALIVPAVFVSNPLTLDTISDSVGVRIAAYLISVLDGAHALVWWLRERRSLWSGWASLSPPL